MLSLVAANSGKSCFLLCDSVWTRRFGRIRHGLSGLCPKQNCHSPFISLPFARLDQAASFKGKPRRRRRLAWKCTRCAHISVCRLHLALLSIFIQSVLIFLASCLGSSGCSRVLFALYLQWRAEKSSMVTYLTFCHALRPCSCHWYTKWHTSGRVFGIAKRC